jgi:copper homeostasis protein
VDSLESALSAEAGGADRLELCHALSLGGLTPSDGLIHAVCRTVKSCRVHVLIRPRPGDFLYTSDDIEIMRRDVIAAVQLGAHGVVLGMLNEDGDIDIECVSDFVGLCRALGRRTHMFLPPPAGALLLLHS